MNKNLKSKDEMIEEYNMSKPEWDTTIERYMWHIVEEGYFIIEDPKVPSFISNLIRRYKTKDPTITLYEMITKISVLGYKDDMENKYTNEKDFLLWLGTGHEEELMIEWLKITKQMNL